ARATSQAEFRIDRNIVALIRAGRWRRRRSSTSSGSSRRACGGLGGTASGYGGGCCRGRRCARGRIDCSAFFIARRHGQIIEDTRRTDDGGGAWPGEGHLDDLEAEARRVRLVGPCI